MSCFLVVNDDGVESPMLRPMVEQLGRLGDVCLAVPRYEQSWRGKAMTRFGRVAVEPRPEFGVPAFAVEGTPSDCVNLALHHLFDPRPDFVISGINIGTNTGLAFVLNSGTIGAALEGALQGLPALAFSAYLEPRHFALWMTEKRLPDPRREDEAHAGDIAQTCAERMADMTAAVLKQGLPPEALVLNVNFPGAVTPQTPVRWVPLQDNRYGSLFKPDGNGGFVHGHGSGFRVIEGPVSDREVVMKGEISATALGLMSMSLEPPASLPF
ncbi:MAG: 5'/3'-nucleotidase SurE [Deltaproteobacteria bacterium]|nr:5'/3'-nucleotidase SurE [Deltaproteobacteria bacterium]